MMMISVVLVFMVLGAVGLDTCGEGKSQCTQDLENDAGQKSVIKDGKAPTDDVNEVLDESFLIQSKKVQISEEVEDGLSKLAQVASRGGEEIQEQVIEDKRQGSGSGAYTNAGSVGIQVSRHLASNVVNPGEVLCDDCIMKFNSSGGCDAWQHQKEVGNSCLDGFTDACLRQAIAFCAIVNKGVDEGKGMALLEQREVKDDQSITAGNLVVKSASSLGAKAGGEAAEKSLKRTLGEGVLGEVIGGVLSNGITGGLSCIPGIDTIPFVGDFLGANSQDMPTRELYGELSKQIGKGFEAVQEGLGKVDKKIDALGIELGNLKTQISSQTNAIKDMLKTSTANIISTITVNSKANLAAIQKFRSQAQLNHEASMSKAREAMFDSHHRQCLEYMTNILAKYSLYELALSSILEVRQELIDGSAIEWTKHELKYCTKKIQVSAGPYGKFTLFYGTENDAKAACLERSSCFGVYFYAWEGKYYLCDGDGVGVSGASHVIEKGSASKNEALLALKESKKLFNFLSGTGMGTVIDFQQLYVCSMKSAYTESLLTKFIKLKTNNLKSTFQSSDRKASLELVSDILDTGKMSFDMQDMQLLVVDHLQDASRAEFAIKVGMQLTVAFSEFRTAIHNAQTDLSFLDFTQWPNHIIVEYGHHEGKRDKLCPGGFDTYGLSGTYSPHDPKGDPQKLHRAKFEKLCQDTIEACVVSETCNEALVWANMGEFEEWEVYWYYELVTTPKGFGCDPGNTMNVRTHTNDGRYNGGAFAAFLILKL